MENTKIGGIGYGEYTIIAKSVSGGIESESGETVLLSTVAEDFETSRYILSGIEGEIEGITKTGEYTIRIDVKNNYAGNDFTAQLIVAQFNEKDEITAVSGSNVTEIYETAPDEYLPVTLETSIIVTENTKKVTVYLWNSVDGMDELLESRNLK